MLLYLKLSLIPLFLFFSLIIWLNPYKTVSLEGKYTDHIRHTYTAYAFWQIGTRLYTEPLMFTSKNVKAERPHVLWQGLPFFYPIGQVLFFTPFGILNNETNIDERLLYKIEIFIFMAMAFYFFYLFLGKLKEYDVNNWFILLTFYFMVNWILRWTLNGTYDIIAITALSLGIIKFNDKRYYLAIIFISLAFFLHFRTLTYLPIYALSIYYYLKSKNYLLTGLHKKVFLAIALTLTCSSLYTLYLCLPLTKLVPFDEGWVYYKDVSLRFVLYAIVSICLIVFLTLKKEYIYALQFGCVSLFFTLLIQMKYHHSFILFPVLLLSLNKNNSSTLVRTIKFISPFIIFWMLFKEDPKLDIWYYSFEILLR